MLRLPGRPYGQLRDKRAAAARDGRHDGDGLDDDGLDDEAEDGADDVADDGSSDDGDPEIRVDRPRAKPRQKYSRTVEDVTQSIERRANEMLRGLPVGNRFDVFLHVLIANFACSLAGVAHVGQRITFREGYTEAEFGNVVIAAVAKNIRERALQTADQRPDLYINLRVAAVLEGKDRSDDKNLGLDELDVDLLRHLAISAFKRSRPREEIAFREAMLARDLTVKDRALTLTHLATAYGMAGNEQKALEIREQLLVYLRSGIETEYAACDMEFTLPVAVYRVRLSIANSKERLLGGPAGDSAIATIDDERIAACTDLLEVAEVDPDFRRDALELLIGIFKRHQDFRMALRYSLRVLGVQKEQGPRDEEARARIVERTRALGRLCPAVKNLQEALEVKDTLKIDALIEWVEEAEAQGNLQAQIALREEILHRSVLRPDGEIKTLVFLSYNYEEAGEYEKALICLERVIEIKRRIGDMRRGELRYLQERGEELMRAIPPDPAHVLSEALRNPMVKALFVFLTAFQSNAQAWVNGDGNIKIPAEERPALIAAWANILQNEEQILAVVENKRLRGLMHKFRDSLSGGNVKNSQARQMLAILQPPAQPPVQQQQQQQQ